MWLILRTSNGHEWHTDCEITELTEPVAFGFDASPGQGGRFTSRWRYSLASEDGGTRLSESFESPTLAAPPSEMNPNRRQVLVRMLNATLTSIKADIEASGHKGRPDNGGRGTQHRPYT